MAPHAHIMSSLTGSIVTTSTSIVPPVAESAAPTEALVLSLRLQQLCSCFHRGLLYVVHLLILLIATMYALSFFLSIMRTKTDKSWTMLQYTP